MKVSELIEELRKLMVKHGDVHVIKSTYGTPEYDEWVVDVFYFGDADGEFDSEFLPLTHVSEGVVAITGDGWSGDLNEEPPNGVMELTT